MERQRWSSAVFGPDALNSLFLLGNMVPHRKRQPRKTWWGEQMREVERMPGTAVNIRGLLMKRLILHVMFYKGELSYARWQAYSGAPLHRWENKGWQVYNTHKVTQSLRDGAGISFSQISTRVLNPKALVLCHLCRSVVLLSLEALKGSPPMV